jgi:plastocyanin
MMTSVLSVSGTTRIFSSVLAVCLLLFSNVSAHTGAVDSVATVHITESGFEPKTVTVEAGQVVFFINERDDESWVASNLHPTHTEYPGSDIRNCGTDTQATSFDTCRGIAPGERFVFQFTTPGTWKYHDHLKPSFTGEVSVTGESSRSSGPRGWVTNLSLQERLWATVLHQWYAFFAGQKAKALAQIDVYTAALSDTRLEHLVRVFGYDALLDALEHGDAATGNEGGGAVCHLQGHYLGRMSFHIYGISALEEGAIDRRCQLGFYHGAIEASLGDLGSDEIIRDVSISCGENTNIIQRASCYHAIGHGLLVHHEYNLPEALTKCQLIVNEKAWSLCYHGVYMENAFVGLGFGLSHETSWVDLADRDFPCTSPVLQFDTNVVSQCYFSQPVIWSVPQYKPSEVMNGCLRAPSFAQKYCYMGVGFNAAAWAYQTETQLEQLCALAPKKDDQIYCAVGTLIMTSVVQSGTADFKRSSFCHSLFGFSKGDPACDAFVLERLSWAIDL